MLGNNFMVESMYNCAPVADVLLEMDSVPHAHCKLVGLVTLIFSPKLRARVLDAAA